MSEPLVTHQTAVPPTTASASPQADLPGAERPRRHETAAPAWRVWQPGFISCVLLLSVLAGTYAAFNHFAQVQLVRLPIPLRRKLDELDRSKLFPYRFVHASTIKGEMLETLGTEEYISWLLQDTTARGPEQIASLFVTYYTGKPDQVPHVPDVCYTASGAKAVDAFFRDVPMPALGPDVTVPVKVLILEGSTLLGRGERVVMYTFHANGQFAPDRRDVQRALSNPLDRHAYFTKVEVTFGAEDQLPPRDVAIAAGERLLQVAIPLLVKEHWPDWEAVKRAEAQQEEATGSVGGAEPSTPS